MGNWGCQRLVKVRLSLSGPPFSRTAYPVTFVDPVLPSVHAGGSDRVIFEFVVLFVDSCVRPAVEVVRNLEHFRRILLYFLLYTCNELLIAQTRFFLIAQTRC